MPHPVSNPYWAPVDSIEPPTRVRWRIVGLLMGFSFMSWFNRVCMAVAADDQIMPQFGISPEAMGTVYSAFFLAYTICMTPGGWVADRFGPRVALTLMGIGSAVFVACTGLAGLAIQSAGLLLMALLIIRSLMGIFTAPIYPSSARIIAFWLPLSQRAGANGLVQGFAGLGTASSYLVFGWLVARFSWQIAFLMAGAVTAFLALVWSWYGRNRPTEHRGTNRAEQELVYGDTARNEPGASGVNATEAAGGRTGWGTLLRNRSLLLLTVSYAAVGYFEYLFIFWIHYYFKEVISLESTRSKVFAGISQAAFAGGMIVGGWLSDRLIDTLGYRWGRAVVPLFGMTASALLLLLATFAEEPGWIATWIALANGAVGMCEGPVWATAIELGGRQGATAAGICNTGGNAGGMIAPVSTPWLGALLTPMLGKATAWRMAIAAAGVICLLGVSLWFWIDPGERADEERL